ncbi:hypothetical protein NKH77_22905 [Streptomyces sp. M19]
MSGHMEATHRAVGLLAEVRADPGVTEESAAGCGSAGVACCARSRAATDGTACRG